MPTYRWAVPLPADQVTTFTLQRSIDDGDTWTDITTIANDTTVPAAYDADLDQFFYVDDDDVAGEIVRIRANNVTGSGPWAFHYGPPARPTTCNVYGVLLDPFSNQPWPNQAVLIESLQARSAGMVDNANVASKNQESAVVGKRSTRVVTDASGRWQIDLVAGMPVRITIPRAGLVQMFRVPALDVLNFRDASRYAVDRKQFGKSQIGGVADGPLGVGVHLP